MLNKQINQLDKDTGQFTFNPEIAQIFLKYANFLARRGLIYNTLGNIAIRTTKIGKDNYAVYTKHKGISLEEAELANIVVTDIQDGKLIYGNVMPSIGHLLNREIFKYRSEINAVIHLHPNDVISYFSVMHTNEMPYISIDTPLIMGKPVKILEPNINIEIDVNLIKSFIHDTNCIVMPHHGIVAIGRTVSEAYARTTSIIAEIHRLIISKMVSINYNKPMNFVPKDEVENMFKTAELILYG